MARLTQSYLRWIRPGLDELIQQSQVALESYATQADPERMEECLRLLGLVHASLQMVEIYGIGLLLEEMLLLGHALQAQEVTKADEALEALMAAMVLVSDRLDRILQGDDDSPIAMLGMLNDLRVCRDASLLTSLSLFGGDLDQEIARLYATSGTVNPQMHRIAEKLRASFHKGLLHWLRHPDTKDGLLLVQAVLDKFVEYSGAEPTKAFFGALAALVQSLVTDSLETGVAVKRLMSRVDREIKLLVDGGETAFIEDPEPELVKSILYYVANSSSQDSRVSSTLARFNLKPLHDIEAGTEVVAGVNQELLRVVSDELRVDLLQIKDGLDDFIKADTEDLQSLQPLHKNLVRLADTIGMLGHGSLRLELKQQSEKLADWMARSQMPGESELMDLAAKVLNVELSLEQMSRSQGRVLNESSLPAFALDELMIATLKESAIEMAHVKEQLGLYLEHPANGLPSNLQGRFSMILGALSMLQLSEPEAMLRFASAYISERLTGAALPPDNELTALADLLASIEYFMESISEELGLEEHILDFARRAQGSLETIRQQSESGARQPSELELQPEPGSDTASRAAASAPEAEGVEPPGTEERVGPGPLDSQAATEEPELLLLEPVTSEPEVIELQSPAPEVVEAPATEEPELLLLEPAASEPEVIELQSPAPEVVEAPATEEPELLLLEPAASEPEVIELQSPAPEVVEAPATEEPELLLLEPAAPEPEALEFQSTEPEAVEAPATEEPELLLLEPAAPEPEAIELQSPEPEAVTMAKADVLMPESEPSTLEIKAEQIAEAEDIEILPLPESEQQSEQLITAPAPAPAIASMDEDTDSEILDIFLEEAEEEKDAILEQLPLWLSNSDEDAALIRVRRAFHTLKGSGRLVGARVLGDFAWSIENLLNKVLEGTIRSGEQLTALLQEVLDILPAIIERERTRVPHPVDAYEAISVKAFALAEGKPLAKTAAPVKSSHTSTSRATLGDPASEGIDHEFLAFDESMALAEELAPPEDALGQQDSLLYTTWGNEDPETLMIESRLVAEMDRALAGGADILMPMDETLHRIFEPECRAQLRVLEGLAKAGPASWLARDKEALVDALDTIAGSAHTTELGPIARIARASKGCFQLILESGLRVSPQDMKLLGNSLKLMDQLLGIINKAGAAMPDWRSHLVDLESRLVQLEVEVSAAGHHQNPGD